LEAKHDRHHLKLDLIHSFGASLNQGFKHSIGVIENMGKRKIIFPLAKYLVIKTLENSEQSFIPLSENLDAVTCLAISRN